MTSLLQKINELDIRVDGLDSSNLQTQITTNSNDISTLQIDKQHILTAGDNITIVGNVISSTSGSSTIQPRFMAYRTTDNTFIAPTDVVYNVLKYNLGGGSYNTTTGAYTVPVNGLYMFTAVWHSVSGHLIEANFQKNDVIMSRCQLGTALANFSQNNVSFIECVIGDVININLRAGRVRIIYSGGFDVPQGYTQFTGIKVSD
jgi:hypothetical protein